MKHKTTAWPLAILLCLVVLVLFLGVHFRLFLPVEKPTSTVVSADTTEIGPAQNWQDSIVDLDTLASIKPPKPIHTVVTQPVTDSAILVPVTYDTTYTPPLCDSWHVGLNQPCLIRIYKNGKIVGFTERCFHLKNRK